MASKRFPLLFIMLLIIAELHPASGEPSAITYQGHLNYQGNSFNGNVDVILSLWDSPSGGSQLGSAVTKANLTISNGLFTATLDFGIGAFTGADRWLGINIGTDPELVPRQQLTSTPYAIRAAAANAADSFTGSIADTQLSPNIARLDGNQTFTGSNIFNGASLLLNPANSFYGSGANLTALNAGQLGSGTVPDARLAGTYANALTLNNAGNIFSGSGANLSALNGSSLSSGTVTDARLSSNIPLKNAANTFSTGAQTIQTGAAATRGLIVKGAASQTGDLQHALRPLAHEEGRETGEVPHGGVNGAIRHLIATSGLVFALGIFGVHRASRPHQLVPL